MLTDKVIVLIVLFLFIVVVLGVCIYSYTITKKYNEALKKADLLSSTVIFKIGTGIRMQMFCNFIST